VSSRAAIEPLPDDVLLNIFDFYQKLGNEYPPWKKSNRWHVLAHVCRRWRCVVFGSPLRLNMQLECGAGTPVDVEKGLDIWPRLPIVVGNTWTTDITCNDTIIAAVEHHDRVCMIALQYSTCSLLEQLLRVTQVPFPALTSLKLNFFGDKSVPAPVLPDTFLGGSAPRLQRLTLCGIPFPTLPKLLSSCHDLVTVSLWKIPHTGYISPQVMATSLIPLTRLESLGIGFESPASSPNRRHRFPPPLARINLPTLTQLFFHGASEYFEDFIAQIDTPAIISLRTEFFNQLIFDFSQSLQFVGRTKLQGSFKRARLSFRKDFAEITLHQSNKSNRIDRPVFHVRICCGAFDWQVSSLAQIFSQFSSFCSNVEHLDVRWDRENRWDTVHMDHTQWLELSHPFTSLQRLVIPADLDELISPALQEFTGEGAIEVLFTPVPPILSLEWPWERSAPKALEPTITVSNYPVTLDL
jgi:F-box-like